MIDTERLTLRPWQPGDVEAFFAAVNNDARVMEHFGGTHSREHTRAFVARQESGLAERGFCFWVVDRRTDGLLLGCCGLKIGEDETPIAGDLEIGWRMRVDAWGQGYANEAAAATLRWVWANRDAARVVAKTVAVNRRSRRLMERLGMMRAPELDLEHPALPPGDPLRPHIVYTIDRP